MRLTRLQRQALLKVYNRTGKTVTYRQFRRKVEPGPGCVMVLFHNMYLGIEPDGYCHS